MLPSVRMLLDAAPSSGAVLIAHQTLLLTKEG